MFSLQTVLVVASICATTISASTAHSAGHAYAAPIETPHGHAHSRQPAGAAGYTPAPYHHAVSPSGAPAYGVTPAPYPAYGYSPSPSSYRLGGHHSPSYGAPSPHPHQHGPVQAHGPAHHGRVSPHASAHSVPACAKNASSTTKGQDHHNGGGWSWCLEDYEYPTYDIQHAIEYHYAAVASLYKDVIANTDNSVDGLKDIYQETYLCHSDTAYVTPLRAVNTEGKWRVIVNDVKAHYETLSQTARVEECRSAGHPCPLVPECYNTKCLQKFVYHRFLVYNPYDYYFPFAIESFKLPSSCACVNGAYKFEKYHH